MVQRVFFGPLTHVENARLKDLDVRELLTGLPFVALVLIMGVQPQFFLDRLKTSTDRYVARAQIGLNLPIQDERTRVAVIPLPSSEPVAAVPGSASVQR